jgi:fructose-specific phosphotransferase system component IIB
MAEVGEAEEWRVEMEQEGEEGMLQRLRKED